MRPLHPNDDLGILANKIHEASAEWFPQIYKREDYEQIIHATLGVIGEAGELANVVKKANRSGWTDELNQWAITEAADILIYVLLLFELLEADPFAAIEEKHAMNALRFSSNGPAS